MIRSLTLLAALFVLGPGTAQVPDGTPTERTYVRVLAADGQPAPAGTRVVAIGRLRPAASPEDPPLRLVSDEGRGGRFALRLPTGGRFSLWAEQELEDGARRFSELVPVIEAGELTTLQLAAEPHRARKVTLAGAEPWQHRGQPQLRACPDSPFSVPVPCPRQEDGSYLVPALPGPHDLVWVDDAQGTPFFFATLAHRPGKEPVSKVTLEGPLRVQLTVLDKTTKEPVAGATVSYQCAMGRQRGADWLGKDAFDWIYLDAGQTDAEGRCTAELPWTWSKGKSHWSSLIVRADGYVPGAARLQRSGEADYTLKENEDGPPDITLHLHKSPVLTGRVLDGEGRPIAGLALIHEDRAMLHMTQNSMSWVSTTHRVVHTAADGSFRVSGLVPDGFQALIAVADPEQIARMAGGREAQFGSFPLSPIFPIWQGELENKRNGEQIDVGDVQASAYHPVCVEVVRPNGAPASKARLMAQSKTGDALEASTDRRGRVALLRNESDTLVLAYEPEHGWKLQELAKDGTHDASAPLRIELGPWNVVEGRVVDAAGNGVGGARLTSHGSGRSGSPPRLVVKLSSRMRSATCDDEGRFRLEFPGYAGITFHLGASDGRRSATGTIQVGSESMREVEFTLPD